MVNGRWKMGDGRWEMEDGRWKMEDGRWKMGVVKNSSSAHPNFNLNPNQP